MFNFVCVVILSKSLAIAGASQDHDVITDLLEQDNLKNCDLGYIYSNDLPKSFVITANK